MLLKSLRKSLLSPVAGVLMIFAAYQGDAAYGFMVPDNLVALDSPYGQALFADSANKAAYWPLSEHMVTEAYGTYCGVASAVMVLNSLGVTPPQDPKHPGFYEWTQKNIFTPNVKRVIPMQQLNQRGLSLPQEANMLAQFPLSVEYYYARNVPLNKFRQLAIKAVSQPNHAIIVHFSRKILQQAGSGHFSPLAAYDSQSDRFLLMDVARYKYPPVWVKCKDLWQAMRNDGQYRGFILATNNNA